MSNLEDKQTKKDAQPPIDAAPDSAKADTRMAGVAGCPELGELQHPPLDVPSKSDEPQAEAETQLADVNETPSPETSRKPARSLREVLDEWSQKVASASSFFTTEMKGNWFSAAERTAHSLLDSTGLLATGYFTGLFGKALLQGEGDPRTAGLLMVATGVATALVALRKSFLESSLDLKLSTSCHEKLLDGISQQRLSRVQHPDFQSDLVTVSQNIERVSGFVESNLGIVNNAIQAGAALVSLWWVSPPLMMVLAASALPRLFASKAQIEDRDFVIEQSKEDQKHFFGGRWNMLQPAFLKEMLIFGRAQQRASELMGHCQKTNGRLMDCIGRAARRDRVAEAFSQAGLAAGVFGLIHLYSTGTIGYELAGLALGGMSMLGQRLADFGKLVTSYGEGLSMLRRFSSVISTEQDPPRTAAQVEEVERALSRGKSSGFSLALNNVSFSYPTQNNPSLKEVSLTIKPGEFVIVAGKNGGGKSTLANLIAGLFRPSSGDLRVNGVELSLFTADEWLQNLGILSQEFQLVQGRTLRENIEYGHLPNERGIPYDEAAKMAGADIFINALPEKYDTILGTIFKDGKAFSSGQAQRIALARALARRAPILILDEPTAHLDSDGEKLLFESLKRLKDEEGYNPTILYITHRFNRSRDANQIIVMNTGSIEAIGTHDELMSDEQGTYFRLFTQDRSSGSQKPPSEE